MSKKKEPLFHDYIQLGPTATVFTVKTELNYQKLKIVERWTPTRIERLCKVLSITEMELASAIGMRHSDMEKAMTEGRLLALTPCLMLTMLEGFYIGAIKDKDVLRNFFPNFTPNYLSDDRLSKAQVKDS